MTAAYSVTLINQPDPDDARLIEEGLAAYNLQYAPPYNTQRLAVLLRAEDGKLLGGILGLTWWGWLRIDIMWLDEALRGQDWGTRLMQTAEAEAIRRARSGHHAFLDTMSFQALPFYLKLGYTVFGQLDDLPLGHSMHFLQKELAPR